MRFPKELKMSVPLSINIDNAAQYEKLKLEFNATNLADLKQAIVNKSRVLIDAPELANILTPKITKQKEREHASNKPSKYPWE